MKKLTNKQKIILGSLIGILLGSIVSVTYAFFSYSATGANQQLVAGDIYMHYKETNELVMENTFPSSTYDANKYFEFTVDGKNTNTQYDIVYDVVLNHGTSHPTRDERIDDKFLKFTLLEKKTGESEWTEVLANKTYNEIANTRIWVDRINKNQTSEIVHTYRLYMWIDNSIKIGNGEDVDYDTDTWNDDVYASIKVTVTGDFSNKEIPPQVGDPLSSVIASKLTMTNNVPDNYVLDGTDKYISGCKEGAGCDAKQTIDFNYVWYSGKLWRIVAVYGDNTMKLVTEDAITAIYWGENTTYNGSWVYQWLNEDFNDTLVNKNTVLASGKEWNATETSATTKPAETTMVEGSVGMLNAYEYTNSYTKAGSYGNGYLNIRLYWWLITPYSSSSVRFVSSNGSLSDGGSPSGYTGAVRPSIYLSSSITFAGGAGTRNNPYRIGEDISAPSTNILKLNTRVSGEYVTFKNELFRIVGVENGTTKIVKADYIMNGSSALKKNFGSSSRSVRYGKGTSDTYWDYYLNNTWLATSDTTNRALLDEGTYYLGEYGSTGISYKATICDTTNGNSDYHLTTKACDKLRNTDTITNTYTGYVGLLRVGEMFSTQLKGELASYQYMWLITPCNFSNVHYISNGGSLSYYSPSNYAYAVRPSVNLKSNIIITGGSGTEQDPFEVSLP